MERTLFLLDWLQDPDLRRKVTAGLNKGEARHTLAGAVFFNRLGEIRDRSFEQQRYRASGLNLLTAAIVLWNSVYLDRTITTLNGNALRRIRTPCPFPKRAPHRYPGTHGRLGPEPRGSGQGHFRGCGHRFPRGSFWRLHEADPCPPLRPYPYFVAQGLVATSLDLNVASTSTLDT
jgi:hypothetical protein